MPRYRLDIEYDGSAYAGWQRQAGQHSVQAAIEQAIKGFAGEDVTIRGAGRTDAGVHAAGQVAHVDLAKDWPADTVRDAVNAHLQMAAETVSVLAASVAARRFRRPLLGDRPALSLPHPQPPRAAGAGTKKAWWVPKPLDAEAMHEAAQALVGRHDFTTFRSCSARRRARSGRSTGSMSTRNGEAIEIRASARSFLHNQVRSMVGSLKRVGEGGWTRRRLAAALDAQRPRRLRPGGAARRALSHEGRLSRAPDPMRGQPDARHCSP